MAQTQGQNQMCSICCDPFTKQVRKPITCPVSSCGYSACQTCYKTFLTTEGVTTFKCMQCNTEFTPAFLREHFPDSFIKKDLRQCFMEILVQRQVAQLPTSQPRAERELQAREKVKELARVDQLIRELTIEKRILTDDIRFLRNTHASAQADSEVVATFQRKCCDPECPGFVSSAWKCGICNKFSCAHCHEVKGSVKEEIEAHVCDPSTVESIRFLKNDTKPCPACGVYIHKTEGCDQMFCTACKQLWSWKTGRIEKNGHNPHYLEWMRSRGGGGGGVGLRRDPNDVQCGREIDRHFAYHINAQSSKIMTMCKHGAGLGEYCPGVNLMVKFQSTFDRVVPEIIRSLIHLRHYDIREFQDASNVEPKVADLRVSYLCKDFNLQSFRRRVFNLHRSAEISRNVLDLLVAVQNAATDILYRVLDCINQSIARITPKPKPDAKDIASQDADYITILRTLEELDELHTYAQRCIEEIYWAHSMKPVHQFRKQSWFALKH